MTTIIFIVIIIIIFSIDSGYIVMGVSGWHWYSDERFDLNVDVMMLVLVLLLLVLGLELAGCS